MCIRDRSSTVTFASIGVDVIFICCDVPLIMVAQELRNKTESTIMEIPMKCFI